MITRQTTMLDFLHGFHRKTRPRAFLEMMDATSRGRSGSLSSALLLRGLRGQEGASPGFAGDYPSHVPPACLVHPLRGGVEGESYANPAMAWFAGVASLPAGAPTRRPSCASATFSMNMSSARPCSGA